MTNYKLYLPFEMFWDSAEPDDLGITIQIKNSTDTKLKLGVNWACNLSDAPLTKIGQGVMHFDLAKGESIDWAEESIDWVEPEATKFFFCNLDTVRKMIAASSVMSPDLVSFRAYVDGDGYEILSGVDLGLWLEKNVPIECRPFPIESD